MGNTPIQESLKRGNSHEYDTASMSIHMHSLELSMHLGTIAFSMNALLFQPELTCCQYRISNARACAPDPAASLRAQTESHATTCQRHNARTNERRGQELWCVRRTRLLQHGAHAPSFSAYAYDRTPLWRCVRDPPAGTRAF